MTLLFVSLFGRHILPNICPYIRHDHVHVRVRWRLDEGIPSVQATLRFENNKRSAVFAPIDVEEDSCLVTINGRSNKYSAIHPLCHKGLKMWFWGIPLSGGPIL